MWYFPFSALLNTLVSLILGIFVFSKNPKSSLNRSFFYFASSIFIWSICYFIWQLSKTETTALFWCRALMTGAIFIPNTYFHFCVNLIGNYKKHRVKILIGYVVSLGFLILNFTPLFVKDVKPRMMFEFWPTAGKYYLIYVILYALLIIYSVILLSKEYKTTHPIKRNQIRYILFGSLISYSGGFTNFPLWFDIPIPPVGNIFVAIYVLLFAYAILRYQLFNINIILKKGLVYSSLITCITILYFVTIYILERIFQDILGYQSLVSSTIAMATIALIFIPLKNVIQSLIDRYFFKGSFSQIAEQNELLMKEAAQAERYKTLATLTNSIIHEIKNPLTAINGYCHYLPKKLHDEEFLNKFSTVLANEVQRINSLLHHLNQYSNPTPLTTKNTNIVLLINSTLVILKNNILENGVEVHKKFDDKQFVNLVIDPDQINQTIVNIIINALEAMPRGGNLTIETEQTSFYFIIHVKDTGCGIPDKELNKIFDPFYSTKEKHTGLGLSIAQSIIESHKGKIRITSVKNQGTTVSIILPFEMPESPSSE